METLKSNKNIKIVVSDKGKMTVVCYMTTYNALRDGHFANTNLYQPVSENDIAGRDIETMKRDLKQDLTLLASRTNNPDTKKKVH